MMVGSVLLLGLFVLPLWNITLEAPQYPIPLGMDIYINKFEDTHPHDIKNINLMNHYVGMKYIPETIPEFKIFPAVIIAMVVIGLLIGWKGNYKWFLGWFVLMTLLGIAGMYDFYLSAIPTKAYHLLRNRLTTSQTTNHIKRPSIQTTRTTTQHIALDHRLPQLVAR